MDCEPYDADEPPVRKGVTAGKKASIAEKRKVTEEYLVNMGFYLNDGIKYGLDFLVYTDHPDKVHSKYGLVIYNTMTFQQLVLYQRVCNSNNKTLVVAFVNVNDTVMDIRLVQCERFIATSTDFQGRAGADPKLVDEASFVIPPNKRVKKWNGEDSTILSNQISPRH